METNALPLGSISQPMKIVVEHLTDKLGYHSFVTELKKLALSMCAIDVDETASKPLSLILEHLIDKHGVESFADTLIMVSAAMCDDKHLESQAIANVENAIASFGKEGAYNGKRFNQ